MARAMAGRGVLAALLALLVGAGCANYDERLAEAHRAFYSQNALGAVDILERQVTEAAGDTDELILKLEYASALQAAGRYTEAWQVLEEVDAVLETLDYTSAGLDKVIEFAFAPEAAIYRASPPERVMLNTQAMITRLADGEVQGASVEARKLRNLLTMADVPEDELFANRFAWGLAGFALERAGRLAEADGAYRDAAGAALDDLELVPGQVLPEGERAATILIVGQLGQAPIRREATYYFPVMNTIHRLNLPAMVGRESTYSSMTVKFDGEDLGEVPVLFDYGEHARARYDDELPTLLAAAAVQAGLRAAVSEAAAEVSENAYESSNQDDPNAEAVADMIGFFVGLLVDWSLAEAAGADTRCWTLLPRSLAARRLNVAPGKHTVEVMLIGRGNRRVRFKVPRLEAGETHVINVVSDIYGAYVPPPSPQDRDVAGSSEADAALRMLELYSTLTFDV